MIDLTLYFNRVVKLDVYVGTMSSNNAFQVPLVAGDTGPKFQLNLRDAQRQIIAVSGMAVNFYLSKAQSPNEPHANLGHEGCSSADYTTGQWIYNLAPGDVSGTGTYFGDVEIIYDDGTRETAFEAVRLLVRENFKRT